MAAFSPGDHHPVRQPVGRVVEELPVEPCTFSIELYNDRVYLSLHEVLEEVRPQGGFGRRADLLARMLHQRAGIADVGIADIDAEVDVLGPPAVRGDAQEGLLSQSGVELANYSPERVSRKWGSGAWGPPREARR